jgi:hypothetical protein
MTVLKRAHAYVGWRATDGSPPPGRSSDLRVQLLLGSVAVKDYDDRIPV